MDSMRSCMVWGNTEAAAARICTMRFKLRWLVGEQRHMACTAHLAATTRQMGSTAAAVAQGVSYKDLHLLIELYQQELQCWQSMPCLPTHLACALI